MSINYRLMVLPRHGSPDSGPLAKLVEKFQAKKEGLYYEFTTDDLSVNQSIRELRHDYEFGLVIDDPKSPELSFKENCPKLKLLWDRLESHKRNQVSYIVGTIEEGFAREMERRLPPESGEQAK